MVRAANSITNKPPKRQGHGTVRTAVFQRCNLSVAGPKQYQRPIHYCAGENFVADVAGPRRNVPKILRGSHIHVYSSYQFRL
jgi:hypothetical protein